MNPPTPPPSSSSSSSSSLSPPPPPIEAPEGENKLCATKTKDTRDISWLQSENTENMRKSKKPNTSRSGQSESLHVTFAEHTDQYVINSDSGIFLATDDVIVEPSANDPNVTKTCRDNVKTNKPVRPIIKLQKCVSVESQDNPFLKDGELRKKADYIINNSTISRKRIRITDPDVVASHIKSEAKLTPESECVEIVKISEPELSGVTYLSSDDVTIMDVYSSDSNKDQSSTEDVRSFGTLDRSATSSTKKKSSKLCLEFSNDKNASSSEAHDRLLNNLPAIHSEEEAIVIDPLETSSRKPLLPIETDYSRSTHQPQMPSHKLNGDNVRPQVKLQGSKSSDQLTNNKSGTNPRVKKKKKCCLLQ